MENGITVRPHGYFSQRYTILPAESKAQLGTVSSSLSSPSNATKSPSATTSNSAGGVTDFTDEQFICAFHNSSKKHAAKSEREKGPRQHIRRLSFCFRHKRGAIEEEGKEHFAARCLDAGYPQLKLWMALQDGVALERVPIKLQAVTDVWIEMEETVAAASSNLIPVAPVEKNNYSLEAYQRRQARRLLGIDDDEEENLIQSLMQMEETRVQAYVAFERCPPNTMPLRAINALKQQRRQRYVAQTQIAAISEEKANPNDSAPHVHTAGAAKSSFDAFNYSATSIESALARHARHLKDTSVDTSALTPSDAAFCSVPPMAWSSAELTLILSHVAQFAKLTTQFTRKGTRRRSGNEPTIMLDIDEDHIYGQLDEDVEEDLQHRRQHSADTEHTSIDADSSTSTNIPRVFRVFLPIGVIETCCKLRDNRYVQSPSIIIIQHDFDSSVWDRATFPTATPLTGAGAVAAQNHQNSTHPQKAAPPPVEKPPARSAMVGVKTSMFLLGLMLFKYSVRDDCDIAILHLSPPMKKPPFLLDDDGQFLHEATYRSVLMQLVDGEDTHRPGPSQVLEALREEGCGTFRSRRGSVFPPNMPLTSLTSPGTSPTRLNQPNSPSPPLSSRKPHSSSSARSRGHHPHHIEEDVKSPASRPAPPVVGGIPHSGSGDRVFQERTIIGMVTLAQRQRENQKSVLHVSSKQHQQTTGSRSNDSSMSTPLLSASSRGDNVVQKTLSSETKFETNQRDTIRKVLAASQFPPPSALPRQVNSGLWTDTLGSGDYGRVDARGSAGHQQPTPPGSSESTRHTAETAANDTRPVFSSSPNATRIPVSAVFEL
ncbi:Hypothetical protein, putative [Bodo saltans]|uniref:Uncharacterized protein n=1 Tax=Bodo saltans TaxID=75058 RepID=A0A0S4JK73_BODSA|nr:Hypothetical protein, putative [Bodo saltans]|eukprot:CUG91905.1 Hypothetical protein, putative [Bodo saltans]